ncbi:hypothetical protein HAX54_023090 [Datura stramonium]|uniref:Peptidase A1 domain-containing protein n=1 Tax=Datura stramonium TaxID=4076 RepID=A0ABS8UXR2_DATST|nr:hypothetical protein [Datura stramonium]
MAIKIPLNLFSSTLLIAFSLAIVEAKSGGFSIELIHASSKRFPASLSTNLVPHPLGAYMINFSIGTPPSFQLAVADSGSSINWVQCQPCVQCYSQDLPVFNPLNSSTYKALPCDSDRCFQNSCQGSQCTYSTSYVDQSYSFGDVATEKFTFYSARGEELSFPSIVFGCAHRSKTITHNTRTSGIMGLAFSPVSLISQISPPFGLKFSYCFVPLTQLDLPSTLTFGQNVWGTGSLFTPILVKPHIDYYFLTLLGISVGETKLDLVVNSSAIFQEGNIAIDSGATLTALPTIFYYQLKAVIKQAIKIEPLVDDNSTTLCYKDLEAVDVPPVTVHFIAADLSLSIDNLIFPNAMRDEVLEGMEK